MNFDADSDYCCILDVDLEYPKELHDEHRDYPLAPENMNVKSDMISEYTNSIHKKYTGSDFKDEKTPKLILNLNDKKDYIIHIKNLQYYLQKGLKLVKVNRCLMMKQKDFLKPFIDLNTKKRKETDNEFYKDMYKLMNNAVSGKTMEHVRKHTNFEFVTDKRRLDRCLSNPTYKHSHIINENLVGVEMTKSVVKLNKPIFIGLTVSELSKLHMYQFYYDVLKDKYKDKIQLAYTDTDSFILYVETEDLYEDLKELNEYMDFSDYPKDHPNYDSTNKKVLGKFKDELSSKIMVEFIGLKAKMYTYETEEKESMKAKGVPKKY